VRNAVASGRITTFGPDKLIDPELADAQWQRNTRVRVRSASADKTIPAANVTPVAAVSVSYDEARRRRELAEASMAEMKQEELRGDLIRVAVITRHLARKIATMRDAFLTIPLRLAPVLAAETDQAKVYTLLETEIVRAMALVNGATEPESNTP
jgi:phage terminase Nu1 subunit (DNA packaging protein)